MLRVSVKRTDFVVLNLASRVLGRYTPRNSDNEIEICDPGDAQNVGADTEACDSE